MPETPDAGAIEDELFAYAAGALDPAGRARVEARLAAEPALRVRLAWYEAVCESVIDAGTAPEGVPTADEIVERIRGHRRPRGFFAWFAGPALKPAAAVAAALVLVQGLVIGMLASKRDDTPLVRSAGPTKQAVLVVAFDPQAREGNVRALLLEAGARIIDGPRQLGEYRLAVPANRAEHAKSLLEQSKLVEYVRIETP